MSTIKSLKILQIIFSLSILIWIVGMILGKMGELPAIDEGVFFPLSFGFLICSIVYLTIAWHHRKDIKLIDKIFVIVVLIPLLGPFIFATIDVFK